MIFMLRHAEKDDPGLYARDKDIRLTPRGWQEAARLGEKIARCYGEITLIKSSPVRRCVETAEAIAAYRDDVIVTSCNLGAPGVFVTDGNLAAQNFTNYGVEAVVKQQLEFRPLPGMRGIKDGVEILRQEIIDDFAVRTASVVYITHDAILMPFVNYLTKNSFSWFSYLEGVQIALINNNLVVTKYE